MDAVYADVLKAFSQFKKATPDLNKKLQNTPVVFVLGEQSGSIIFIFDGMPAKFCVLDG